MGYKNQRMWNKQSGKYINFVVGCRCNIVERLDEEE